MDLTKPFELVTDYSLRGDQPQAVDQVCSRLSSDVRDQVILGVTGSGKTFTMASIVAELNRPALVMAPNKTLAAQLFTEFKQLFPHNAVEYFVSYYDYYQPEAYLPHTDTYIEKDAMINDDIDKLRHAATHALLTRRDVLIVASVSCIYGLGSPEYYAKMIIPIEVGLQMSRDKLVEKLVDVQYSRNDYDFSRGTFRIRGDVLEIIPAYSRDKALRIEFFGDEIEGIWETDPLTGEVFAKVGKTVIYPASHYVSDRDNLTRAASDIRDELGERIRYFEGKNMLVEAQRIEQKTMLDLEMIEELGYCNGIENYSRHLDKRKEGEPPATLLDYFPKDFILFMDESHISVPQVGGMYNGDRSRKSTLVDFGFRLPSALDNRPLNFEEFLLRYNQGVFVSATPGPWETGRADGNVSELVIRPTGLLDPEVDIRPVKGQVDDLMTECKLRVDRNERVLVTTLTKRMAEDLTEYLNTMGVSARYLHSDIDTLERIAIIQSLRQGEFDVLVGINLLREGLDIPEVSLVAILDADKEGFLRSERSLIQTIGRAARNSGGKVIMYADRITDSMARAVRTTEERRQKQAEFNAEHGITPTTIRKNLENILEKQYSKSEKGGRAVRGSGGAPDHAGNAKAAEEAAFYGSAADMEKEIKRLEREMREAAKELEFEKAASIRDKIFALKDRLLEI